jgi:DNA-binding transcriptional ArsR family regulator
MVAGSADGAGVQRIFAKVFCMMPEVPDRRKATREEMRALAHPLRLEMFERLREGPSTASRLARELGESSGATSYHLRVLARAGLVEEDETRKAGRTRWWRRRWPPKVKYIYMPTDADDPEGRALAADLRSAFFARDETVVQHFVAHEPELEREWRGAAFVGSWTVHLTPEETEELGHRTLALVAELRRRHQDRPPEARRVLVTFRALPWLE